MHGLQTCVQKSKAQILKELREKAADRKKWREIVTTIVRVIPDSSNLTPLRSLPLFSLAVTLSSTR